jgi:hypothetical protein
MSVPIPLKPIRAKSPSGLQSFLLFGLVRVCFCLAPMGWKRGYGYGVAKGRNFKNEVRRQREQLTAMPGHTQGKDC